VAALLAGDGRLPRVTPRSVPQFKPTPLSGGGQRLARQDHSGHQQRESRWTMRVRRAIAAAIDRKAVIGRGRRLWRAHRQPLRARRLGYVDTTGINPQTWKRPRSCWPKPASSRWS
jgi:hypothetical protein